MPREAAPDKAKRYLSESRLRVVYVKPPQIRATCRGGGQTYRLGFDPSKGWFCNCEAMTRNCSHLLALRLVAEPEGAF